MVDGLHRTKRPYRPPRRLQANPTTLLLDRWKLRFGHTSDTQAAIALGLVRSTVSNWRKRGSQASPTVVRRMVEDLGDELVVWLTRIEAVKTSSPGDREVWEMAERQYVRGPGQANGRSLASSR